MIMIFVFKKKKKKEISRDGNQEEKEKLRHQVNYLPKLHNSFELNTKLHMKHVQD